MTNENDSDKPTTDPQGQRPRQPPVTPPARLQGALPYDGKRKADDAKSEADELAREFRAAEKWVIGTNITLAVIGIIALCIYHGQLDVMRGQLGEIIRQFPEIQKSANANVKSADQTEKAVREATDNFKVDQRAWVGLMGSNHVFVEITKGSPVKASVDIANFGRTPALNEASFNKFVNHPIGQPMPTFSGCAKRLKLPGVTLMPSASANVTITTDRPGSAGFPVIVSDADIQGINNGKVQLFLSGCIWYDDVFGSPHRTEYCLQYMPHDKAFGACAEHNESD